MKDAIGGTWLYIIVIAFIALFTAYVSFTTTYSRCFRIKDEVITIIEHYRGFNDDAKKQIQGFLSSMGYNTSGKCPDDGKNWNAFSVNGNFGYGVNTNYCIAKNITSSRSHNVGSVNANVGMYDSAYYQVVIFFKIKWPMFHNFFKTTISGETQVITNPQDSGGIMANYM